VKTIEQELLEALKKCVSAIREEVEAAWDGENTHPTIKSHAKVADHAESLIARAEGKV
jgi:hypothetical protein